MENINGFRVEFINITFWLNKCLTRRRPILIALGFSPYISEANTLFEKEELFSIP